MVFTVFWFILDKVITRSKEHLVNFGNGDYKLDSLGPIRNPGYITHVDNLESILEIGILSRDLVVELGISPVGIHDQQIVIRRGQKGLWPFANLYLQPRNAMLFKEVKNSVPVVVIWVDRTILVENQATMFSDGNAASSHSNVFAYSDGLEQVKRLWEDLLDRRYWNRQNKSTLQAECLIPRAVDVRYIKKISVQNESMRQRVEQITNGRNFEIVVDSELFFDVG